MKHILKSHIIQKSKILYLFIIFKIYFQLEGVNKINSKMNSAFNCDTIPPEPNIFTPGFFPDRANR